MTGDSIRKERWANVTRCEQILSLPKVGSVLQLHTPYDVEVSGGDQFKMVRVQMYFNPRLDQYNALVDHAVGADAQAGWYKGICKALS